MMITEDQIETALKVLSPIASGLFLQWLKRRSEEEGSDLLAEIGKITTEMKLVVKNTPAERFLIFRSQNQKNRTASVILEEYRKLIKSVYSEYQGLTLDADYLAMLERILEGETVKVFTKELPENALLKRIYEAENIECAIVFELHKTKKYLYYASIASTQSDPLAEKISRNEIGIAKDKISKVFQKYAP